MNKTRQYTDTYKDQFTPWYDKLSPPEWLCSENPYSYIYFDKWSNTEVLWQIVTAKRVAKKVCEKLASLNTK